MEFFNKGRKLKRIVRPPALQPRSEKCSSTSCTTAVPTIMRLSVLTFFIALSAAAYTQGSPIVIADGAESADPGPDNMANCYVTPSGHVVCTPT
jgi:hypothetical protein